MSKSCVCGSSTIEKKAPGELAFLRGFGVLVHYIFVKSLYHVGKHVSKNGHVRKNLRGIFRQKNLKSGGATTTPLLSAECQTKKKSALKLDISRG